MTTQKFRALVWRHYRLHGRHDLPWRKTKDPYKILVSEVMLQQTQVERVLPYHERFLKKYRTVQRLASASLGEVLILWQGLGYNRRAKMLHEAAKVIVSEYKGKFPQSIPELEMLPGVGHYTARAIAAFAWNTDVLFIETNIRTAITHHFFPSKKVVNDSEVFAVLTKVFPRGRAREWYAALMDYGAFLKRSGVRINKRAKGYTAQSPFKGSDREARGALLRALAQSPCTRTKLLQVLSTERKTQLETQLTALLKEGLVTRQKTRYSLPNARL